jgi:uncharacterized protein YqjF (DUF2071 family)
MPQRRWSLRQNWINLTFLHWEVNPERLIPHIPEDLELDTFNGKAYIGTIPFTMEKVRPYFLPYLPFITTFPEFNVRTYVKKNGKPGVLFLSLDAQSHITCTYAPKAYGLPYKYSKGCIKIVKGDYFWYSKRSSDGLELEGNSKSSGNIRKAEKDTLEYFLFERYCLYVTHKEKLYMAYTQHNPWEYSDGDAVITKNSLTESFNLGINNYLSPDLVHVTQGVKVRTWSLGLVNGD